MYAMVCVDLDFFPLLKRSIDYNNCIGMRIISNDKIQTNILFKRIK